MLQILLEYWKMKNLFNLEEHLEKVNFWISYKM